MSKPNDPSLVSFVHKEIQGMAETLEEILQEEEGSLSSLVEMLSDYPDPISKGLRFDRCAQIMNFGSKVIAARRRKDLLGKS